MLIIRTCSQLFHMSINHFSSRSPARNEVSGFKIMPDRDLTPSGSSPQVTFSLWLQILLHDSTLFSPSLHHTLCCPVCLIIAPIIASWEPLHGPWHFDPQCEWNNIFSLGQKVIRTFDILYNFNSHYSKDFWLIRVLKTVLLSVFYSPLLSSPT